MFPFVHHFFQKCVEPYIGQSGHAREVGKVYDNVSVLALSPMSAIDAAMDYLYQGIDDDQVTVWEARATAERLVRSYANRRANLGGRPGPLGAQ